MTSWRDCGGSKDGCSITPLGARGGVAIVRSVDETLEMGLQQCDRPLASELECVASHVLGELLQSVVPVRPIPLYACTMKV